MDQLIEVDSHGTCVICLKICDDDDKLQTENQGGSPVLQGISDMTLKVFLRYLQIDVSKLTEKTGVDTNSSSILAGSRSLFRLQHDGVSPTMKDMETGVKVNTVATCRRCSSVMNDFLALFQSFEKLRLRLAECVETVHDLIQEGEGDDERVREFRRRKMTAAPTQSSRGDGEGGSRHVLKLNVERLRRETLEKCALRQKQSIPQIVVKRQSIDEDSNGGRSPSSSHASEPEDQDLDDEDQYEEQLTKELLLTDDEDDEENEVTQEEKCASSSAVADIRHPLQTISYGALGSNNQKFLCRGCPKQFFCEETLLKHTVTYHPSIPNERGFLTQCQRQRALKSASEPSSSLSSSQNSTSSKMTVLNLANGRFGCGQCGKQYTTRRHCLGHFLHHHNDNGEKFNCLHCGKTIVHWKKFEAHLLLLHPLKTIGHKLPKNTNQHQLDQAVNAILNKKRRVSSLPYNTWSCPLCPRRCTPRMFKLHVLQSHTEEIGKGVISLQQKLDAQRQKQGICSHCSKSTSHIKLHLMLKHPVETLSSQIPPQTTEQDLNAALRNVIVGMKIVRRNGRLRHTCTICESSLITFDSRGLKYHIYIQHLDRIVSNLKTKPVSTPTPRANEQADETTRKFSKGKSSFCQVPVSLGKNILPPTSTVLKPKPKSLTRPTLTTTDTRPLSQRTIIQQPQANEPRFKFVHRSLSASSSSSALLKSSNSSSLNQCPHCGTLFPFKSSLNAHLTSAHPFQLYFNRLPPGTNEINFDKAIDHLLDQPQADSFLSDQLGCRICASSPISLIAVQTFPDRSYLKRHLLGKHLDKILERLSEAENEIRVEVPLDVGMLEMKVEDNENLTIHPDQDPLTM